MNDSPKSVNIVTLGCSKNQVDSEVIAYQLKLAGFDVSFESVLKSDIVIINTCGFILDAKEQSIETILSYLNEKQHGNIQQLYVVGCLVERYKKELLAEIPEIDGCFDFLELPLLLQQPAFNLLQNNQRVLSTPSHYAYMKVSEGCDRQCSFCAIPTIRGKHISKPKELLIEETRMLADQGVKELILIAQDLTYYGVDIYKSRQLASLLSDLAKIDGISWIRLHYGYPANFPFEILDVMNDYPNICRYLDIPFQHISDEVLKSMRRGNNATDTYTLIDTIRKKVPDIALRTTLISGYPTETAKQHQELMKFVQDVRFERLGVFSYSQEEGTPAYSLGDPIKTKEKSRRLNELMTLQEQISIELNEKKVGKQYQVIIDDEDESFFIGRSEFDSPDIDNLVLLPKENELTIGDFYPVRITNFDAFDLYGEVIS